MRGMVEREGDLLTLLCIDKVPGYEEDGREDGRGMAMAISLGSMHVCLQPPKVSHGIPVISIDHCLNAGWDEVRGVLCANHISLKDKIIRSPADLDHWLHYYVATIIDSQ